MPGQGMAVLGRNKASLDKCASARRTPMRQKQCPKPTQHPHWDVINSPSKTNIKLASSLEGYMSVRNWMCVIWSRYQCRKDNRATAATHLDECSPRCIHKVPVDEANLGPLSQGQRVCRQRRQVDGDVVNHVRPSRAPVDAGIENRNQRRDIACEEGEQSSKLEDKVCACEAPVVLGGKYELDEENREEGEDDCVDEDLGGQGARKVWAEMDDGVDCVARKEVFEVNSISHLVRHG
jgi:hypothetical protein